MSDPLDGGPAAVRIVMTWKAFRLHALECDSCARAAAIVVRGGDREPDFPQLHFLACRTGRPLLEVWKHAVEERMDEVREQMGLTLERPA